MAAFVGFITDNLGTIIVALALVAVIALISAKMLINKKKGKSSCGCGCATCPMSAECHKPAEKK